MTTTESRHSDQKDGGVGTTVVLDTCVLLADPFSLYSFGDAAIVIPLTVIEELDGHKSRLDDVGRAARAVVRDLERLRVDSGGDFREPVALPTGGTLRVAINGLVLDQVAAHGLNPEKADNRILAAALGLTQEDGTGRVKIVSADAALRIKASQLGLAAEDYHRASKGRDALGVRGWHKVDASRELIDALYASGAVPIPAAFDGMVTNEYVVLSAGSSSALARVFGDQLHLVERRRQVWGLNARSKEQIFALEFPFGLRRDSAEPSFSRCVTSSFVRSPAMSAAECTVPAMNFEELLAGWDGEDVVIRHDAESGAWMFVGVHSTVLGPAVGGTRMRVYPTPADGLRDVLRLSAAMTQKLAGTGYPRGGGKAVLAVPELPTGEPRKRLLRRYGELVASLGGT